LGISYAVFVSGNVSFTRLLAICSAVRPLAGLLINCIVPPSPPRKSARTPVGLVVILYA
jgi:hypothetical protein